MKKLLNTIITATLLSCGVSQAASLDADTKKEIEAIIDDYVSNHPEIIINAMKKLERDEQAKTQQAFLEIIAEYRKSDSHPYLGKKNSKHYIIEFFDFNCGYCKVMEPYFEKALKEYDLQIIYVNIPVIRAESAQLAYLGQALFETDPSMYFKFHKHFMTPGNKKADEESVKALFKTIGADYDAVLKKIPSSKATIEQNIKDSFKLKITGTPYLIIDGQEIRGAITSYEQLKSVLK
ncbi:MAG: thioredoxin domain-containing protein [Succinivibrio dextrinosolvens]|uniref:DsbA family protein n=1 Tax=Succinivibrio sp. TaxID=2053619 RepID=UPI0025E9BE57|nr:thioredoxin domain-containing protein [Succinivibrio sp.]MBQ9220767.1 thioredoxin domain-containing protein [Succinivibrio sp.]MDY6419382.1 thioredoxin domain-containing protein [Succinivibrio dextrinosolvens]MDY6466777.1 thioredoxin domain-containing protein [Succinivibrio dextrinosolvens]